MNICCHFTDFFNRKVIFKNGKAMLLSYYYLEVKKKKGNTLAPRKLHKKRNIIEGTEKIKKEEEGKTTKRSNCVIICLQNVNIYAIFFIN